MAKSICEIFSMSGHKHNEAFSIRRCGFTLIELLVVISIISMLMSIMLPGLSHSRELGRRVVCLSNMRSLSFAWMLYAQENDDFICSSGTGYNDDASDYNWVADGPDQPGNTVGGTQQAIKEGVLYRYIETVKIYKCKSDKTALVRSYSISNTMGGYNCGCGNMTTPFTGTAQITAPSERMVFIDADSVLPDGGIKWIMDGFKPATDTAIDTAMWDTWYMQSNNLTGRHGDGYNLSFADGHVDHRNLKDELTLSSIVTWSFSQNETADKNVDLEYLMEVMKGPMDKW
jgi:prepilin-type N-terminal cleavage/methylation domain-containing protein/prepilin-type processing-associated H-X9-DG protein